MAALWLFHASTGSAVSTLTALIIASPSLVKASASVASGKTFLAQARVG